MSPKRGGQSTQSGIYYQNSIAALYLGRLCDSANRPLDQEVIHVRVETFDKVDDVVITFSDQHKLFIQAKENITVTDKAWKKLWQNFEAQYLSDGFEKGMDRLRLQIGAERSEFRALQSLCENAKSTVSADEWRVHLTKPQSKIIEKIRPLLSHQFWSDELLWDFYKHLEIEVWSLAHIERDLVNVWMPETNKSSIELFRLLRDRVGGQARIGASFTALDLRTSITREVQDFEFHDAPDVGRLHQIINNLSGILRQHQNTWGQTKIHLDRPIVQEILSWINETTDQQNNVGMLVDQAGMGKTVVMRDILQEVEARNGMVLALKADQQLSDVSSSDDLRKKLAIPYSIEVIVERLAKLGKVVILIDQLDALSLTLAHDEKALNFSLALIAKLRRIPNVVILASCRLFDRNSDPRLRQVEINRHFSLSSLNENEIRSVLSLIPIDYNSLSKPTRDLLATPLHLSLFVYSIQSGWAIRKEIEGISSLQELYYNLWNFVIFCPGENIPSEGDRYTVLKLTTEYMDKEQKITVPHTLFYTSKNEKSAVTWLASRGILIESKLGWTFLHQTFFDYCFARFFVESKGDIVNEIMESPQGLFERSKLIQVLSYLRGFNHTHYLSEIQRLLGLPNLRFHLYDLLVRWFGSLPNPSEAEWIYAKRLLIDPQTREKFLLAMQGNSSWFGRIKLELLPNWLLLEDNFLDNHVVPYMISLVSTEQVEIVTILESHFVAGENWTNRIYTILTGIQHWNSQEAALLFEKIILQMPKLSRFDWHEINSISKVYPDIGCRFVDFALSRMLDEYLSKKSDNTSELNSFRFVSLSGILDQHEQTQLDEVIRDLKEKRPAQLLERLLAFLDRYYSLFTIHNDDRYLFVSDEFSDNWHDDPFRVRSAIIQSLIFTLSELAKIDPVTFKTYSAKLSQLEFATPQRLLARVYSMLPEIYAKEALSFLLADQRRLNLGGRAQYESRRLIKAIFPHLTLGESQALERHILAFDPIYKHLGLRSLQWRGLDQLYLLQSIPTEVLSTSGKIRLRELTHKFPATVVPEEEPRMEGGFVGSPIPSDIATKMTDRDWLSAMRKYKDGYRHRDFLKGGAHELSTVLLERVKNDPAHFFSLLQKIPNSVSDSYVAAFIDGFAEAKADPEMLFYTIRRFSAQPGRNIRRTIAWAIEKLSFEIADDLKALLLNYLTEPIGEDELWWSKGENHGDVYSSYLNSDRGSAFEALNRVWSKSETPANLKKRWMVIESVVSDPSTALRAGAIHWLTFLLRHDRDRAISLFEKLVAGHEVLLTLMTTREFIYWAFYKNFSRLFPYVQKMLESDVENTQEQGAQLVCIAAISPAAIENDESLSSAKQLVEKIIDGKSSWRRGAARIFSINITGSPKDVCEDYLIRLLDDTDETVRNHIDDIFHALKSVHVVALKRFIEAYAVKSKKLNHYFSEYLLDHGLIEPVWTLKIIRTSIQNMELSPYWHSGIEELIRLVLKIYTDPTSKTIQKDAMDVFDLLIEKYSNPAYRVLEEWDRR